MHSAKSTKICAVYSPARSCSFSDSAQTTRTCAIVNRLYGEERIPLQSWIIHQCEAGKLDQEIWESRGKVQLLRVDESLKQIMIDIEQGVRDVSRTV